ncbi:MAG: hypothetical protein QHH09_02395 [Microgenomates group bacterium]|nr:hypothetical protein [Microgenomates group bacterium]
MIEGNLESPKLEKKPSRKRAGKTSNKLIFLKISLIIILLIFGFIFAKFAQRKLAEQNRILGAKAENYQENIENKIGHFLKKTGSNAEEIVTSGVKNILSTVSETVVDTASKSAGVVSEFVFENTIGNLLKQIEKLPPEQKEQIKKEICR